LSGLLADRPCSSGTDTNSWESCIKVRSGVITTDLLLGDVGTLVEAEEPHDLDHGGSDEELEGGDCDGVREDLQDL